MALCKKPLWVWSQHNLWVRNMCCPTTLLSSLSLSLSLSLSQKSTLYFLFSNLTFYPIDLTLNTISPSLHKAQSQDSYFWYWGDIQEDFGTNPSQSPTSIIQKSKWKKFFDIPSFPHSQNRFITSQMFRVQHQTWELPFSFQCFDPIKQKEKPELYM